MSEATRYPLVCWDSIVRNDEHQYLGPYETEAQAREHVAERNLDASDYTLRRCRRISGDELKPDLSHFVEMLDERAQEGEIAEAFGPYEDDLMTAKPGAEAALREWASKYLNVALTICEGDE